MSRFLDKYYIMPRLSLYKPTKSNDYRFFDRTIKEMFQSFDSEATDCFVEAIKTDSVLRRRISEKGQLDRLRVLGNILLESEIASSDAEKFLQKLCDTEKTDDFYTKVLPKLKKA